MHIKRTHNFEEKASEMPNLSSHLFSLQKKKKKKKGKKESSQTSSKLLHVHSLLKFDGSYFKITFISNFEF